MNNYQCTMSQLRPSNELMEKLMNNQTKITRHRRLTKPLLIAAVIMALLVCGILGANAATNGALFKGVSLILNGENVDINRYATSDSYIDDEGNVKITLGKVAILSMFWLKRVKFYIQMLKSEQILRLFRHISVKA